MFDDPLIPVQYCPCGCTGQLPQSEITETLSGSIQLQELELGFKLDAVILPSTKCLSCRPTRRPRFDPDQVDWSHMEHV